MIDLQVLVHQILKLFILIMQCSCLLYKFLSLKKQIVICGKRFIKHTPNSESSFRQYLSELLPIFLAFFSYSFFLLPLSFLFNCPFWAHFFKFLFPWFRFIHPIHQKLENDILIQFKIFIVQWFSLNLLFFLLSFSLLLLLLLLLLRILFFLLFFTLLYY